MYRWMLIAGWTQVAAGALAGMWLEAVEYLASRSKTLSAADTRRNKAETLDM